MTRTSRVIEHIVMQPAVSPVVPALPERSDASDAAVVERVLDGSPECFAVIMRRYNGRLFRIARSVTRDDAEAEDALQHAYLAAFRELASFRGEAKLSTWLTTIVVREASRRRRAAQRRDEVYSEHDRAVPRAPAITPEDAMTLGEIRSTVEATVDSLPETYRAVLVMRDVEQLSGGETATALDLTEEAVRVRLHRARAMMRERLARRLDVPWTELFEFGGRRCDRMVAAVWSEIRRTGSGARERADG